MPIERLWRQRATASAGGAQTRIDAEHPLDIYADFQPPDHIRLVAVCASRPPTVRPMRVLSIEEGRRADGRWTLRLSLLERSLLPVCTSRCRDIVTCTRSGVDEARLGQVIVRRLVHWRALLEREVAGLGEAVLRGLIGELLVLRDRLLPVMEPLQAVSAWKGPFGASQDFVLPNGHRLEVKTVGAHADQVRVNGLNQPDSRGDLLTLVVVREEGAPSEALGTVTGSGLIGELRGLLADEPEALGVFEAAPSALGWQRPPSHGAVALRVVGVDAHDVGPGFPRLTKANVPAGVLDADYLIVLPGWRSARAEEAP